MFFCLMFGDPDLSSATLPLFLSIFCFLSSRSEDTDTAYVVIVLHIVLIVQFFIIIMAGAQMRTAGTVALITELCLAPSGVYCGFYLYQSLKTGDLLHGAVCFYFVLRRVFTLCCVCLMSMCFTRSCVSLFTSARGRPGASN